MIIGMFCFAPLRARARGRRVGRQRADAHRRDAERRVVGPAEQHRLLRAGRGVDQHARHEGELVPGREVRPERCAGLYAARAVAENGTRQHPPRGVLEIFEREKVFEPLQPLRYTHVVRAVRPRSARKPRHPGPRHLRAARLQRADRAVSAAFVVTAFLTGWPSIIAVIINYVKRSEVRGTWLDSHFSWQIRTFWFAALWVSSPCCSSPLSGFRSPSAFGW